ncbi:tetraspanin-32 isoform X1 [Marmota monax]|uniref:tetraspanin-32 isoform X1 n=1 Tax=Marmota monax TaxID=9995 RepID=UPI0026F3628A|nr:tetraspanin-32 isoform X1 [Marmota monax]
MHLRPGRAAVVQGPAWQETTQRSRGEGRPPWGPGGESGSPSARCWSPASLSWASCASPWCSAAWCRWPSGGSTTPPRAGTRGQSQHWSSFTLALQVEDAMLDTYDLVYDEAVRSPSSIQGPKLAAIQDTFLCCGKRSPFQLLGSREADPCRGEEAAREVRSRQSLLAKQDAGLGQSPTDILDLVFPTPSEPSWKGLGKGPLGGRQQVATVQEAHSSQLDPGLSRGPFCQLDTRHGLHSPLHTAPSWVLPKARWTDPQKLLEAYRKGLCAGTQRGYRVWLGEAAGRAFQEDS